MMIPVLIVGAGPTGLVLALWLTKMGVPVRIIDRAKTPGTTSRALVIHARTLEFYRQLGLDQAVLEKGFLFPSINLWVEHEHKATAEIFEMGVGETPYPYLVIFPQDQHEDLLITELKNLGVEVEREKELLSLHENAEGIRAILKDKDGTAEAVIAQYVAGCDGASSTVRHEMDVKFEGLTYPGSFYVADVEGSGSIFNGELHVSLDQSEFLAVFPLKAKGTARFIGVVRDQDRDREISWQDVNYRVIDELGAKVTKINWFSSYKVHHRVAEKFCKGRVFILGDASHIHSPVGGQGMNTGIGDAVNLAWKLAEVINGKATIELLETYESERIEFAKNLVHTTDLAFQFISSPGKWAQFVRTQVAPIVIPQILKYLREFIFEKLSQTGINYRTCNINQGEAGKLHGGDRLPWIESLNNFTPFKKMSWQIHIYGEKEMEKVGNLEVIKFPWNEETKKKGLVENAAYVVRPDGYIGFISPNANMYEILDYGLRHGFSFESLSVLSSNTSARPSVHLPPSVGI